MAFPEVSRVIYKKSPSEEVICQVRFPAILKIDTEPPATFQEHIRSDYPFYKNRPALKLAEGMPPEVAGMLAPLGGQMAHHFTSQDEKWTVALTRDFLALTCRNYDRWENFLAHLKGPLDGLQDVYAPAFYTRIGLRYRDVIRRSALGLENAGWADLLQPWVAGAFGSPVVAADVEHSANELLIRLPDGPSHVRVWHGINFDEVAKETCYVIDADFFNDQQTELSHALNRLDFFNKQAHRLFRWCIKESLHNAMEPTPAPDS
jgi:uncharacterized protein (TIGR04255 family)